MNATSVHGVSKNKSKRSDMRAKGKWGARSARRWEQQAASECALLTMGLRLSDSPFFFTITRYRTRVGDRKHARDYNRDDQIRAHCWHRLSAYITRTWPDAAFYTAVEYANATGVHLHGVVRNAPGLTKEWMESVLQQTDPDYEVSQTDMWDAEGLANYITKTLSAPDKRAGWPRYFHITAKSRDWIHRDEFGTVWENYTDLSPHLRFPLLQWLKAQTVA